MGVDMSNKKSTYILGGIVFLALMAMVSWPIGAATATTNEPKNGWGEATSEEAGEEKEGEELGEHASDPDGDGTKGNDNQEDDDDENSHRSGLGNVADAFTGQKNPDELGDLLDCADGDDPDDEEDPADC
jgi:hypothetical protein